MLSPTQKLAFRRDGYLVVPDVLTTDQLRRMNSVIDDMVDRSRSVTTNTEMYDLEDDHRPQSPRVRGLRDPLSADPIFEAVSLSDAVLDPVESLLGHDIRRVLEFVNIKPPGSGPLQFHQDFAILPYTNDDLVVCGLALTDSTRENGCLHVIPGSHQGLILDHHQDGVMIGAIQADDPGFDAKRAVPVEVPAGAMSIHHFRTLHGSPPNTSANTDRRVLWFDYAAEDAYPIGKPLAPNEFARQMVRGEYTGDVRMVDLDFPVPNRARKANVLAHLQAGLNRPTYPHVEGASNGQ